MIISYREFTKTLEDIYNTTLLVCIILYIRFYSFMVRCFVGFGEHIHNFMDMMDRYRVIHDSDDVPYLERYYLFIKDRDKFPFNIFVHKFLKSDPDDLHDHPWPYVTIILKGGYWEYTYNSAGDITKTWKGAGSILFRKARSVHRIEIKKNISTWTLFIPGPKLREWGFITNSGWINNAEYLKEKKKQK